MSVISSRSSMAGLSSHRPRRRRSGIGVRLARPLMLSHHQKRHSTPNRAQAVIDYHLRRLFPRGLRRGGQVRREFRYLTILQ
jgi:hypothetical protein